MSIVAVGQWPIRRKGQAWYRGGHPELIRFAAGSWVEHALVLPLLALGAVVSGVAVVMV
jgi:hypothetical protein